jgi:hypothetical protein
LKKVCWSMEEREKVEEVKWNEMKLLAPSSFFVYKLVAVGGKEMHKETP